MVFVFGADVTQQKQAERALRQSEKMATLGTLAAGVAHELNNPLAGILGMAEGLRTDLAERHYSEHRDKPFFGGLVEFITSSPVLAMVWEGPGAVAMVRAMMGTTNPASSAPGTIRGDLAVSLAMNVVHGSDSPESATREVAIFFTDEELLDWENSNAQWVLSED